MLNKPRFIPGRGWIFEVDGASTLPAPDRNEACRQAILLQHRRS